jgi:hypothetical protein
MQQTLGPVLVDLLPLMIGAAVGGQGSGPGLCIMVGAQHRQILIAASLIFVLYFLFKGIIGLAV